MSIKVLKTLGITLGITAAGLAVIGAFKKPGSVYKNEPDQQNPMEGKRVRFVEDDTEPANADGKCGHLEANLEAVGETQTQHAGIYEKYVKRGLDIILSFGGLVVLSPVFAAISIAIYLDDPGPVLFTQKRVGKNKQYFKLHKFRSMRMSTPHDKPTHMLQSPDQYITRVGRFLRSHSLDELAQIWDIWVGNMSVIGPRPALWNQDWLVSERDKYSCSNDIKPGLTGWAQINGRDELEICEKAKLDGEYTAELKKGGWRGLVFDIKCFMGSIGVFAKDKSVVEGGTGELHKQEVEHKESLLNERT